MLARSELMRLVQEPVADGSDFGAATGTRFCQQEIGACWGQFLSERLDQPSRAHLALSEGKDTERDALPVQGCLQRDV